MGWGIGGGGRLRARRAVNNGLAAGWFKGAFNHSFNFSLPYSWSAVYHAPWVGPAKVIKLAAARVIPRRILTVSLDGRIVGQDGWRIPPAGLYYTFWAKRPADMGDGRPRLS